jgi:hypothetical protein
MRNLTSITDKRHTILLAEIAGLLHNLGKLDPNFPPFGCDKETLLAHDLYIPREYNFKRFAAPHLDLMVSALRGIVEGKDVSSDEIVEAMRTTPDLLARAQEIKPAEETEEAWLSRVAEAGQDFNRFCQTDGPLYLCHTAKRKQEREHAQQRLSELESEIAEAKRLSQGPRIGELYQEKSRLSRRLNEPSTEIYRQEREAQTAREQQFRTYKLEVAEGLWPLSDLLTLFWDDFFWKPRQDSSDGDYERVSLLKPLFQKDQEVHLPALLVLSHGEVSGGEKNLWLFDADGSEVRADPSEGDWAFATAFGYDRAALDLWALQSHRFALIEQALAACADPAERRAEFVTHAEDILRRGLGDTQWPINEIDLWDYASAIAALFKSGVARAILDDALPTVGEMRWRFLSVRFDGLGYLGQAHHVTDLLGCRASLEIALDAVQELLEVTYPLGNEVYRDENGAVFIVPGWDQDALSVLTLQDGDGVTLEEHIQAAFREATGSAAETSASLPALAGELKPVIREGNSLRGKAVQLGAYLADLDHTLTADPTRVAEWWRDAQAKGREICTVCGVRPVGWGVARLYAGRDVAYYREQADQRKVCGVCMKRRGRRAEHWLTDALDTTIWTDEVVDKNSRFALLVGKFDLTRWLDGALIPTMQKPASFARVQRCWETTEAFWNEVEAEAIPEKLGKKRNRLRIIPRNARALDHKLGKYHTYELEIEGQGMGVVWDPVGQHFITTENLADLARRWDIPTQQDDAPVPALQRWLASRGDRVWALHEPSGYTSSGKPQTEKPVAVEFEAATGDETPYTPYIPLLSKPSVFMALIPAAQAMDIVAAIRQAYEREMSKVQDRLPLHLGVVIAPRRTPLRAVLDAGRALLERPTRWEAWNVAAKPQRHGAPPADPHLKADAHFAQWWEVSLEQEAVDGRELTLRVADRMGDGETEDVWHAHFCTTDPGRVDKALHPQEDVTPVSDLAAGAKVYLYPATFDFEYLDTTARRFTLAYNQDNGRRLGRASRPYLLHHVANLQEMWRLLGNHLKSTQLMWIHGLIEEKRRDWQEPRGPGGDYTAAFRRFVEDTLRTAEWKQGSAPVPEAFDKLKAAAIDGTLADVVDLYHEAMKLNLSSSEKEA